MKYTVDELASKLEEKARQLREKGLTEEDMNKVSGGYACECCGSSCRVRTDDCQTSTERGHKCMASCIMSSPD